MRISDWSSDVCSSDLWHRQADQVEAETGVKRVGKRFHPFAEQAGQQGGVAAGQARFHCQIPNVPIAAEQPGNEAAAALAPLLQRLRSEEHTSELQSLMRISYAVF